MNVGRPFGQCFDISLRHFDLPQQTVILAVECQTAGDGALSDAIEDGQVCVSVQGGDVGGDIDRHLIQGVFQNLTLSRGQDFGGITGGQVVDDVGDIDFVTQQSIDGGFVGTDSGDQLNQLVDRCAIGGAGQEVFDQQTDRVDVSGDLYQGVVLLGELRAITGVFQDVDSGGYFGIHRGFKYIDAGVNSGIGNVLFESIAVCRLNCGRR